MSPHNESVIPLGGPELVYTRVSDASAKDNLSEALRLVQEIEQLLDEHTSNHSADRAPPSCRMASAMAASLAGELESLVRVRKNGTA